MEDGATRQLDIGRPREIEGDGRDERVPLRDGSRSLLVSGRDNERQLGSERAQRLNDVNADGAAATDEKKRTCRVMLEAHLANIGQMT